MNTPALLKIALVQISPVWLERDATLKKVEQRIEEAGEQGAHLAAFGETLAPGYPFWIERTNGAVFNSPLQKELYAHYARQSVQVEAGHLDGVCAAAARWHTAVYLGIIERPPERGGHSLYATLVYINPMGEIASLHRKLMPTYEERLVWSIGDGNGLRVHRLGDFTVGGLNCWENWMPLVRAALYAQGENLHVAVWPGGAHLTQDITRFIAKEGRSYVLSVSGLMRRSDIPESIPHAAEIRANCPEMLANGGSCLAGPDGEWVIPPQVGEECLLTAEIDLARVLQERQNFDPSGHYARPDVTRLALNRNRQSVLEIEG